MTARGRLPRGTITEDIKDIDRILGAVYAHDGDPLMQWAALTMIRRQLEEIFREHGGDLSSFETATTMKARR